MGREEEIIKERGKKLQELRRAGINPYPHKFDKKHLVKDCLKSKVNVVIKTAGRVMTKREIGKIVFSDLMDFTGRIQLVFQNKETPGKDFEFFSRYVDIGDMVGIEGRIFKTKTGQQSVLVKNLKLLAKSILPLPDKWHGLQDKEERYRKRYLDLIMNPEIKKWLFIASLILFGIVCFQVIIPETKNALVDVLQYLDILPTRRER
mgnify:CR=1 FL=1